MLSTIFHSYIDIFSLPKCVGVSLLNRAGVVAVVAGTRPRVLGPNVWDWGPLTPAHADPTLLELVRAN